MGQGHLSTARLIGVYDADGTVIGELGYVVKRALGRGHCSLCAITHGAVRERRDWQDARAALPVPFEAVHRDEQPRALAACGFVPPFVAVETGAGDFELLLDADALEACEGSPAALVAAIEHSLGDASR